MTHTKQDLINSIKEMKDVYSDPDTPQNVKDSIKLSLNNAEKLLKELEEAEKPKATEHAKEEKPTASEIVKATMAGNKKVKKAKAKKEKVKKEKAPVVKMTGTQKQTLKQIVASAAKYAKYHGKSEGDLQRDAARKAKKPGTRTSRTGHKYREYRANRSDVNTSAPHLAKGGQITNPKNWLAAATEYLDGAYGMDPNDMDLDIETAKRAIADKENPREYIDAHAEKHDLYKREEFTYDMSVRTMKKFGYTYNSEDQFAKGGKIKTTKREIEWDTTTTQREIDWDKFEEEFKPIKNKVTKREEFNGWLFETYGKDEEYIFEYAKKHPNNVWTIIDSGYITITNGLHHVNRFGYVITKNKWKGTEVIDVIDPEDREDFDNEEDEEFSEGGVIGTGKNGYIAFYKGKKVEVMADSSYGAQQTAAAHFKAKKSYDVSVVLAEIEGKQVTHTPNFAGGGAVNKKAKLVKFKSKYDGTVEAYESVSQPDLYFYVSDKDGHFVVVGEAKGFPASEAYDDWLGEKDTAMKIAKMLAEGKDPGNYAKGGEFNVDDELGKNTERLKRFDYNASNQIEFGSYKTTALTAEGKAAFEQAIADLEREDKDEPHYKNAMSAMGTLIRVVDSLLTSSIPDNVHNMLQSVGIYNYKTGLVLDTHWLSQELATRKLGSGGGFNQYGEPYGFIDPDDDDEEYSEEDYQDEDRGGTGHGDISYSDADPGLKKGGRLKSALNRDRKYKSNEPWEQSYHRRTKPSNPRYKTMHDGGVISGKWIKGGNGYSYAYNPERTVIYATQSHNIDGGGNIIDIDLVFIVMASELIGKDSAAHLVEMLSELFNEDPAITEQALNAHDDDESKKKGGRLKSALNRDRKYKSDQPWEQAYHRRTKPVNPRYKHMAKGGMVGYMEKTADKIVSHYLPGANSGEVVGRNYRQIGDYNIDTDIEGDGSKNVFINVYFGNKYGAACKEIKADYHKYAAYLEKLANTNGLNSEVLTNDEDETVMFKFSNPRTVKYFKGGTPGKKKSVAIPNTSQPEYKKRVPGSKARGGKLDRKMRSAMALKISRQVDKRKK